MINLIRREKYKKYFKLDEKYILKIKNDMLSYK